MKKMLQFVDKYYLRIKIIACIAFSVFVFFFFISNFFAFLTLNYNFFDRVFENPYYLYYGERIYTDYFCIFWMFVLTALAFTLLLTQIFVKSAKVSMVIHMLSALILIAAFVFAICLNLVFLGHPKTFLVSVVPFFRITTFVFTPLLAIVNIILFWYKLKNLAAQ